METRTWILKEWPEGHDLGDGRLRASRDDRAAHKALDQAGAETQLVSPKDGQLKAWTFTEWGDTFPVDMPLDSARLEVFDAILLPVGLINPDKLRTLPEAIAFMESFFDARKPGASICHRPWTIIEVGAARLKRALDDSAIHAERGARRCRGQRAGDVGD